MRKLYNVLYWIGFVICFPFFCLRIFMGGDWRRGFWQRFGHFDINFKQSITNRHLIWLQAPAKGRMDALVELLLALEKRLPNVKFVVSATTSKGMSYLKRRLSQKIGKIYHPLDRRDCVGRALATIHPRAIILVEPTIRFNFVWRARVRGFTLFLVNARLSDRYYSRYQRCSFLFRQTFAAFSLIGAQNEDQAAKLRTLGATPEAIHVLGEFNKTPDAISRTVELILSQLASTDLYIAPATPAESATPQSGSI